MPSAMADVALDARWVDVYASKGPYAHIHEEDNEEGACFACSLIHYQLDVFYNGGHYWTWQVIDSVDFHEATVVPEIDKWIWEEMIGLVDDHMKKIPKPDMCTFNPQFTCASFISDGNGHCCKEYNEYEREVAKLQGA